MTEAEALVYLEQAVEAKKAAQDQLDHAVAVCRTHGWPWQRIARVMGLRNGGGDVAARYRRKGVQ